MRFTLAALLAGLFAIALANPTNQQAGARPYKVADKQFLQRQKDILTLFKYINQPSYFKEHVEVANSYSVEKNVQGYTNETAVENFLQYYRYHLLPRGQIFSVFYQDHLDQAIALFNLFYYAKDFDTFYKTAVWARNNVNEGMFLYSVSVAIVHRKDTHGIVLPPIYEIYPNYFFSSEVINKASYYKQVYQSGEKHTDQSGWNGYTINSNYSGHYLNLHPEQSMSYYLEDVGINSFYYYYNLYYPYWLGGQGFNLNKDKRGEFFYYVHQQLLARYYLERLSNDFGEVETLDWNVPFRTGYYPSLQYTNGLEFPTRPNYANLYEYFYNYGQRWNFVSKYGYSHSFVVDYERRIRDAIDTGYVYNKEGQKVELFSENGLNILGNLIESNADSPNSKYYGAIQVFARHLLGYSYQPLDDYKLAPSALEHFETSLRDPAFYQLYKKIILYFQRYMSHLPSYTKNELYFPGVEVSKVEFDRLMTYFDYFYSDLNNAVYVNNAEFEQNNFNVRVRQARLNHKPFTYRVTVKSEKATNAAVKVFLGPKYDEYGRTINISENRVNFVEFDYFTVQLKAGENVFNRNSRENYYYSPDRTSYRQLYEQVLGAYNGNGEFHLDQSYFFFPQRYMLPKGSYNGQAYQFYVFVYPVQENQKPQQDEYYYPIVGADNPFADGHTFGYPLDRFVKFDDWFVNVPNSYFYEAKIYHRKVEDINSTNAQQ